MKAFKAIFKTELKLSLRGMDMLIFAIFLPALMVFLLGSIFGNKPAFEHAPYTFLEQSFAALSAISISAGGIMGLPLVISDYRSKKILKRLKITPIRPSIILIVQLVIYSLYSLASLLLNYIIAALIFQFHFHGTWYLFAASYLLVMLSTFSIGLLIGGLVPNPKIAGIAASLLYFPTVIFSGATLPYEVMPPALQHFADILPLSQGIKLLKASSLGLSSHTFLIPVIEMIVIAIICIYISIFYFNWDS